MTLAHQLAEGSADLSATSRRYTLRRVALVAASAAAFVTGLSATSAVLLGEADPGVVPGAPGESVVSVSPTGFAYRSGVRPGQLVVAVSRSDEPQGWRLETVDAAGSHVASAESANAGLRASLPLAVGSLLFGAFSVLLFGARRQWVLPAAGLTLVLGSNPLGLHGNAMLSTFAMGSAAALAAGWAITKARWITIRVAIAVVALAGLTYWAVARTSGLSGYDELEWLRANGAALGMGLLVIERGLLPRLSGEAVRITRPRTFDLAAVAILAGLALTLVYVLSVPTLLVAALGGVGVLLMPVVRRRFRPFEDALLADVRRQAAVQGAEEERARLARELHDVPLQELVGILRRLEVMPGAEHESDDLRAVVSHIRNVAMDLRPPVLDDLGLVAALESMTEESTTSTLLVIAAVEGQPGFDRRDRPPEDVELAMFRIAAEAVQNAIRHSGASRITVRAQIKPTRVELGVEDNGFGISPDAARRGRSGKHLGIASMRRRAEAIDADLTVERQSPGTLVHVVWEA